MQLLLDAVSEVVHEADRDLSRSVQSYLSSLDPWNDACLSPAFASALSFAAYFHGTGTGTSTSSGRERARDLSLFVSVWEAVRHGRGGQQQELQQQHEQPQEQQQEQWTFGALRTLYSLLPSLGAAMFVSPSLFQPGSQFDADLQVCARNEHILQPAMAKLLVLSHNLWTASLLTRSTSRRSSVPDPLGSFPSLFDEVFGHHAQSTEAGPEAEETRAGTELFRVLHIHDSDLLAGAPETSTATTGPIGPALVGPIGSSGIGPIGPSVSIARHASVSSVGSSSSLPNLRPGREIDPRRDSQDRVVVTGGSSERECLRYVDRYLTLAGTALQTARHTEHATRHDLPILAMHLILAQFVA
jgi:hypothetical protein